MPSIGCGVPPEPPQSGDASWDAHHVAGGELTGHGDAGIQLGGAWSGQHAPSTKQGGLVGKLTGGAGAMVAKAASGFGIVAAHCIAGLKLLAVPLATE